MVEGNILVGNREVGNMGVDSMVVGRVGGMEEGRVEGRVVGKMIWEICLHTVKTYCWFV